MSLFTDRPAKEIYTLSLHDALPISAVSDVEAAPAIDDPRFSPCMACNRGIAARQVQVAAHVARRDAERSEEHTSELQSLAYLVCRLLLEKKNQQNYAPELRSARFSF